MTRSSFFPAGALEQVKALPTMKLRELIRPRRTPRFRDGVDVTKRLDSSRRVSAETSGSCNHPRPDGSEARGGDDDSMCANRTRR